MTVLFLFCEILVYSYRDSYCHGVILLSLEKKMFSSIFWFTGERIRKVEKWKTVVIPSCLSHRSAHQPLCVSSNEEEKDHSSSNL